MTVPAADTLAVLGAGSWGTALALHLARAGHHVRLWGRSPPALAAMQAARENARYLPGARFPDSLTASADLAATLAGVDGVLVGVPSHAFAETLGLLAPHWRKPEGLAWATKGFEHGARALLSSVAARQFGESLPLAILSGPSFAKELAAGLPTAITLASNNPAFGSRWAARLHNDRFRVYTSDDLVGVQVGGAVKNILAVAAGMCDGLGFGANARTALITRGLVEMSRLGVALGGKTETFYGMAGLGDLVLTCTDNQSRNRRFGLALGQGKTAAEAQAEIGQVVEAAANVADVYALAQQQGLDMPITEQVYRILHNGVDPKAAAKELLTRELKAEGAF